MRLTEFLQDVTSQNLLSTSKVFYFFGTAQYPSVFFPSFLQKVREIIDFELRSLDLGREQELAIKSQLETSFLGKKTFYWLHDLSKLKGKQKTAWINYLKKYTGPNVVSFFTDKPINCSQAIAVEMSNVANKELFFALINFFNKALPKSFIKVFSKLFQNHKNLSLDQLCMLMNYALLVGKGHKEFEEKWLNKIVAPEKSLFTLSQHFFEKDTKKFFELWQNISPDYSEQFWIIFWSEQLWRACNVVKLLENKNISEANAIRFRLPFSFMNRSWRKFSQCELKNAHNFIYSVDYSLKNGGSPFSLELFYSKFLSGKFKN